MYCVRSVFQILKCLIHMCVCMYRETHIHIYVHVLWFFRLLFICFYILELFSLLCQISIDLYLLKHTYNKVFCWGSIIYKSGQSIILVICLLDLRIHICTWEDITFKYTMLFWSFSSDSWGVAKAWGSLEEPIRNAVFFHCMGCRLS